MKETDFNTWRDMYAAARTICEKHNRGISMTILCLVDHPVGHPAAMESGPEEFGANVRIYRMSGHDKVTVSSADVSKQGSEMAAADFALSYAFRQAFGTTFMDMCEMHGIKPTAEQQDSHAAFAKDAVAAAVASAYESGKQSGRREGEMAVKRIIAPAFALPATDTQPQPATEQAVMADSASEAAEGQAEARGGQEGYSEAGAGPAASAIAVAEGAHGRIDTLEKRFLAHREGSNERIARLERVVAKSHEDSVTRFLAEMLRPSSYPRG